MKAAKSSASCLTHGLLKCTWLFACLKHFYVTKKQTWIFYIILVRFAINFFTTRNYFITPKRSFYIRGTVNYKQKAKTSPTWSIKEVLRVPAVKESVDPCDTLRNGEMLLFSSPHPGCL